MEIDSFHLRKMGYMLGNKINGGAFSTVHCGLEVTSADVVAIKVINLKNVSLNFRTHFLPRELANIKRFNHPNIIKVRKISRNDQKIHIVMDYARSNLRAEIDGRIHIGEKQARKWFYQLTSAIQYLQVNGVAHRDIKIDNILVDKAGDIKLCDFGFSKLITPQQNSGMDIDDRSTTFCGSIAYCAPEILTRTPYDPWKTDVWSLGVVLYKMVFGIMPFGEGSDLASVRKIARAQNKSLEFPPFPRTSPACQNLIRALLTVESSQRISLAQVLQSVWMNPPTVTPATPPSPSAPPSMAASNCSTLAGFPLAHSSSLHILLRKNPSTLSNTMSKVSSIASSTSSFASSLTGSLMARIRRTLPLLAPRYRRRKNTTKK